MIVTFVVLSVLACACVYVSAPATDLDTQKLNVPFSPEQQSCGFRRDREHKGLVLAAEHIQHTTNRRRDA